MGNVASDRMTRFRDDQRRLLLLANCTELVGTTRMENTARGRIDCAQDLPVKPDANTFAFIEFRNRRKQRLRIGMVWAGEYPLGRTKLHDAAEIKHGNLIRQIADDSQIVGDKDIAHTLSHLEVSKQIENCCLNRDIECRCWFVADDNPRITGKGAGDCHPLLQTAGKLAWLNAQMPLCQADGMSQFHETGAQCGSAEPSKHMKGTPYNMPDRVRPVQSQIRILENDLHRLYLIRCSTFEFGSKRLAFELHGTAGIGRNESEEQTGEGRLAASGFTDKAKRLPPQKVERNIVHCPQGVTMARVGLV